MLGLAIQVMQKRLFLSVALIIMIILTLLNTTSTLGLFSYVSTVYTTSISQTLVRDSYYVPKSLDEHDIDQTEIERYVDASNIYGASPYAQVYGFTRVDSDSFIFLPIKVIEYATAWRLPLVDGHLPRRTNDTLINQFMARHYNLKIGDVIRLPNLQGSINYTICGIIVDSSYETMQIPQQRLFVGNLSTADSTEKAMRATLLGMAFDLKETPKGEQSFLDAYYTEREKPLIAEYVSAPYFRSLQLRQLLVPLIITVLMWLLQLSVIAFCLAKILNQLVENNPQNSVYKAKRRFHHLNVYYNYFMMLLTIAFFISLFAMRPYLANLAHAIGLNLATINSFWLLIIHGVSLGFWMTIIAIINAFMQKAFIRNQYRQENNLFSRVKTLRDSKFLGRLLAIIFVNGVIALLLIVAIESNLWSKILIQHPSLWGFPKENVVLNVSEKPTTLKSYSYSPVVIEGTELVYAKGVISPSGFESFDIKLISGRLPKFPNEVVVGRGLVNSRRDLGEWIRFYDQSGTVRECMVVGIANAVFDEGKILGYIAPAEPTFLFVDEDSKYAVDYTRSVKNHYKYILESVNGFIIPIIVSMLILALGVLIIFYMSSIYLMKPYIRLINILSYTKISKFALVILASIVIGGVSISLATLFWALIILPLINHVSTYFGFEIITLLPQLTYRSWEKWLIVAINSGIIFFALSHKNPARGIHLRS